MANPPIAGVYGLGTTVSAGYPVFSSVDGDGTYVLPSGSYVWNPVLGTSGLWVPTPVDVNSHPISASQGSALTLSAVTGPVAATPLTYLTASLGSLQSGNGVFDAKQVTIRLLNTANEPITSLSITFQDSVGGTEIPITYTLSNLSIGANSGTYTWVLPLVNGIAMNASIVANYSVAPTTGAVNYTAIFQANSPTNATSLTGSNAVVSEQSASYPASTGSNTNSTLTFDLPLVFQASSLYLVTVNVPSDLGTSFSVNFQNQINISGTLTSSAVTSLTAPAGANSYLIQGWMLGDGPALCVLSNTTAISSTASGNVTVQVRKI